MDEQTAESGALACACGHGLIWHDPRQGCGYQGFSAEHRCHCLLPFHEAVQESLAQAWDAGREALGLDMARPIGDDGMHPSTPNPYRATPPESRAT